MIIINYRDSRPIYEQVVSEFAKLILGGALTADTNMPSVRSLAMELSINPNTIQKAYMELERQGYIYTVKGKGSFVSNCASLADIQKDKCLQDLRKSIQEARSIGISRDDIISIVDEITKE